MTRSTDAVELQCSFQQKTARPFYKKPPVFPQGKQASNRGLLWQL
jgi:hypothetical protein